MTILVGSLAFQNWHRQIRQKALAPQQAMDYVVGKTAAAARRFGFSPMGIDLTIARFPSTERAYLEELKAQLRELNLVPSVGFGSIALTLDAEVRDAAMKSALKNLEAIAAVGAGSSTFGCLRNGRVTREGQIRFAIDQLKVIGKEAKALGLKIFQENYDWWTADELIRMTVESGCDNVGIQNDTGNWLITGEDPVESTKKVLPWTMHSHVRDYVLEEGTYNGVAVGDGLVDFERLLPVLAKAGDNGTLVFSIEVDTDNRDEDATFEGSCAFVKDWLVRNGHMAG